MLKIYPLTILGSLLALASATNVNTESIETISENSEPSLDASYDEDSETIETSKSENPTNEIAKENTLQEKETGKGPKITGEESQEDLLLWNKIFNKNDQLNKKIRELIKEHNVQTETTKEHLQHQTSEEITKANEKWKKKLSKLKSRLAEKYKESTEKNSEPLDYSLENLKNDMENVNRLDEYMLRLNSKLAVNKAEIKSLAKEKECAKENINVLKKYLKELEQIFEKKKNLSSKALQEWATKAQNETAEKLENMLNSQDSIMHTEEFRLKDLKSRRKTLQEKIDSANDEYNYYYSEKFDKKN